MSWARRQPRCTSRRRAGSSARDLPAETFMDGYAPPPSTKIVIAATESVRERLVRVLAGHDLRFADSTQEAMSLLSRERFGMVIISVHFDESQMFALLGDIRAHA